MKIACIGPVYPYRGGIAQFNERLTRELAKNNECHLINFTRLYPSILFPGKTQFDTVARNLELKSDRLIDSLNPLSWLKSSKTVRSESFDVAIFHWWHPFFAMAYRCLAGRLLPKTVKIAICHNVFPHEGNTIQRYLTSYGLGLMDGFILHGRSELSEIESVFSNSKHALAFHPLYDNFPNEELGKTEARLSLDLFPADRVILYFGLIRDYKGVDVLLDAMKQLNDVSSLKVLIVGEIYSGKEKLTERISELPPGKVTLVDEYIPNEKVAEYFRAADLVVLPYRSATQSGVIPLAYHYKRPVLATRVGGLPDAVEEGVSGWLVLPDDQDSLAKAIRRFFIELNNPDMEDGIGQVASRLSWRRYSEIVLELIGRIELEKANV